MILLTADIHLDDNQNNEYRWAVFDRIQTTALKYKVSQIYILGDFVDRRDRHSAAFVNKLIDKLGNIVLPVTILRGNHDSPLRGPAFWEFLNQLSGQVEYITVPTVRHSNLLLLPFTTDPKEDWKHYRLSQYAAIFMHATIQGAVTENGEILDGMKLPILPRTVKLYSGDIHTPQQVKNLTYVGAPHPTKFGDNYKCRMLVLDDDYEIAHEVILSTPKKLIISISSVEELTSIKAKLGDQVRIRFNLANKQIDNWGAMQATIEKWAKSTGVTIASTEVIVDTLQTKESTDLDQDPENILRIFCQEEEIADSLLDVGIELLKEVK